ncbi:hypothetical protein ASG92_06640 [Arthrobacter sp. Soil736]|uniref:YegP family protein n=1 Tax=Arthrobacter sp. Soil736 TaxID=1736395 RepID=UPI000712A035|nr:hypothetical protein ASG92_06640 [Arthrobacter sp. Soil736]
MAGMFELFIDADASFRFQLTAPDGTVMAVSRSFPSKAAAVEGIAAVREYAGMGHVRELAEAPPDRRAAHQPAAALGGTARRGLPARPELRPSCKESVPALSLAASFVRYPAGARG